MQTEIAETGVIALSGPGPLPVVLTPLQALFAQDAGAGKENITPDAMALPFLKLMQPKTPDVENDPDNFKPGMLVHGTTGDKFDIREKGGKPILALQCHFNKAIVEWGGTEGKGGIVARHPATEAALAKLEAMTRDPQGKRVNAAGNTLEETCYHYLILLLPGGPEPAVLALKGVGLTPSKKLMRMVNGHQKEPTFARVYAIQSYLHTIKASGRTMQNVRFAEVGMLEDMDSYLAAKSFYESAFGGKVKLDDNQESGANTGGHADAGDNGAADDDNVPF